MSLQTRIQKLEDNCTGDAIKGARDYARLSVQLGCCKPEDEDTLVKHCLDNGLTLAGLLTEVEGATRGLPKPIPETEY